jgi:hypothetical protein
MPYSTLCGTAYFANETGLHVGRRENSTRMIFVRQRR